MTTVKLTTGTYMGVEVPEGATDFRVKASGDLVYAHGIYKELFSGFWLDSSYSLPVPKVCSEWTEEEAAGLIEEYLGAYKDYEHKALVYTTALASLFSLCRAQGWVPERTILLTVNDTTNGK